MVDLSLDIATLFSGLLDNEVVLGASSFLTNGLELLSRWFITSALVTLLSLPDDLTSLAAILFSASIFLVAGPSFLSVFFNSFLGSSLTSLVCMDSSKLLEDSINIPITSELLTISPSALIIFDRIPSIGATTSRTTLSVSISATTSS